LIFMRICIALVSLVIIAMPGRSSYADSTTDMQQSSVALWLFDETPYKNQVAIDASPNHYDLRYDAGARPRPGVFGGAIGFDSSGSEPRTLMIDDYQNILGFGASPQSSDPRNRARMIPRKIITALGGDNWTWEFRFTLDRITGGMNTLVDVRSTTQTIFSAGIDHGGAAIVLQSNPAMTHLSFPVSAIALGVWHHIAFVRSAGGPVKLFLDGNQQATASPAAPDDIHPAKFFMFDIGQRFDATQRSAGAIDEMRVRADAQYTANFAVPGTFSRNYGPNAQPPSTPSGPPLLFPCGVAADVTNLGSRKYVFIDDVLIAGKTGITFTVNPPQRAEVLNNLTTRTNTLEQPGGIADGYGTAIDGPDGRIHLIIENHGMWSKGKTHAQIHVSTIDNSVFERHPFADIGYGRQGSVFRDDNPDTPGSERFKMLTFDVHRGVNLWWSADLQAWHRNETNSLPFDTGGGSAGLWDDQQGKYLGYFRHEGGWRAFLPYENGGISKSEPDDTTRRADAYAETTQALRPWPFTQRSDPWVRFTTMTLPTITYELPRVFVRNDNGEPYRAYVRKYEWAPDTYIAMVPRLNMKTDTRETEIDVSRDGYRWTSYGPAPSTDSQPMFFPNNSWSVNGKVVKEAIVMDGMVRRGDEIWQYGAAKTVLHTEFSPDDRLVLLKSRFDGFTSFNAGDTVGILTTRKLTFAGSQLHLNMQVDHSKNGFIQVNLIDSDGRMLAQSADLTGDSVAEKVEWKSDLDLASLAGRVIQIQFRMKNARLYAMKFGEAGDADERRPVAEPVTISVLANRPTPVNLFGWDHAQKHVTYEIVSAPRGGALTGSGSYLMYTPAAQFNGDSFTFRVSNGATSSDPATVSLERVAVPATPIIAVTNIAYVSSGKPYATMPLNVGATPNIDRPDKQVTAVTPGLVGLQMISTADADDQVSISTSRHLMFFLDQPAIVYIIWRHDAKRTASWMSDFHRVDGESITVNTDGPYDAYAKIFPAGRVILGGPERSETGHAGMYFVVVQGLKLSESQSSN